MKAFIKRCVSITTIAMLILTMIPFSSTKGKAHASSTVSRLYVNDDVYYDVTKDIDKLESEGWFWDASENTLILKGFDGTYLENYGNIKVAIDGENHIRMDGSNYSAFYTHGGVLTVDSVNDTIDDKLIITGEKTGNICAINTGLASAIIKGGSVVIDVKGSGTVEGFGFNTYIYNDAVVDVNVTSTASVAVAVPEMLKANGSGDISLRAEGFYDTNALINEFPIAVNQLVTTENTTSQITLEAVESNGGQSAAMKDFQPMELGIGGKINVVKGDILSIDPQTDIIGPNIKVTPENYILKTGISPDNTYTFRNVNGSVLNENLVFEGQIEDVPLKFVDSDAWNVPAGRVNSSISDIKLMGGFGGRDTTGITFEIIEGTLPSGISMSEAGVISGSFKEITAAGQIKVNVLRDGESISSIDPIIIAFGEVQKQLICFQIDDQKYDVDENSSGDNWSYSAATSTLSLKGFEGNYISYPKDLKIYLYGENVLTPDTEKYEQVINVDGTLTLYDNANGDGVLNISGSSAERDWIIEGIVVLYSGHLAADITGNVDRFVNSLTLYNDASVDLNLDCEKIGLVIKELKAIGSGDITINVRGEPAAAISTFNSRWCTSEINISAENTDGSRASAIGQLEQVGLDAGGELNILKGSVRCYAWNIDTEFNVDIVPDNCYLIDASGSNMSVFADENNNVMDGGFSFVGTDEDFFDFRVNPNWKITGLKLNENYSSDFLEYGQMGKGVGDVEYIITEGELPAGLVLSKDGRISGTPTEMTKAGSVTIELYADGSKLDYIDPVILEYDSVKYPGYHFIIDGQEYFTENDVVGDGWGYNAALKQLTLDGYDGGQIQAFDDLNIKLKGTNIITAIDSGMYCDAIHVQSGQLTIEKDSSDETDILIIKNEGEETSWIDGINATGGTILNGGTLKFEMAGFVTPVVYNGAGEITVNNSANLDIDISSNIRELKAIPGELIANGSGNIDINISCIQQNQGVRYGVNYLTVNEGCTSIINVNYEVIDGADGFAVNTIKHLDFAEGGKLEVKKGGVGLYNGSISKNLQVTPSEYILKGYYTGGGYTIYDTMYDADGMWITDGVVFENTGIAPEIKIALSEDFVIPQIQRYDKMNNIYLSDAFNSFAGRDLGEVTYEIIEGQLPGGLEMSAAGRINGYGMELADPGSIKVKILSDGEYIEGLDAFEIKYEGVVPCQYPPDVHLDVDKDVLEIGEKVILHKGHSGLPSRDTYSADVTVTALNPDIADYEVFWIIAKAPGKAVFKGVSEREDVETTYLNVYVKEKKPAGYYQDGYIKGLDPDSTYSINGDERVTDSEGRIPIEDSWKNRRNKIIKLSEWEQCNSSEQTLGIVSEDSIVLSEDVIYYSGVAIEPDMDVIVEGQTLEEGMDYSVEYMNNINPGTATVEVTGIGAYAGKATKTFSIKPPDLSKPTSVKTELYGYNDIKVKWSPVEGATGYYIYYKKGAWSNYKYYGKSVKTTRNIPNLNGGCKYYFRIYPYVEIDGKIYKDFSYRTSQSIFTLKKLNKPTVKKASKKYVRVSWNNINGETGYQIARSKYKNKNFVIVKNVGKKYKSAKVKPPKKIKYYYKVRAYKIVNGKKIFGPWSKVTGFKLK